MKKGYYIALVLLAIGMMVGCSKPMHKQKAHLLSEWMQPSDTIKVLSTTAMIDDIVGEIGGEHVLHMALIKGELDPHSYELVKGDNEKFSCADVIFYNGLELEHGASLQYQLKKHPQAYSLGEYVSEREELIFIDEQVDPHIWLDVRLFALVIDKIVAILSSQDLKHAEEFVYRGAQLREKMLALDQDIYQKMQTIPSEKRYLITSHDAFFYFARRYLSDPKEKRWKERFAAPEGLAPDGQISSKNIQAIIEYAKAHGVLVIFPESNLNKDALRKIVSVLHEQGIAAKLSQEPLYGDAMGDEGSDADGYIKMMEHNAKVIELWLKEKGDG